jgi:hypothetical protein
MTSFFDLFVRNSTQPESWTDPDWADHQFPELVARSPFRLWQPGDPISQEGLRLLLGVATWSGYDMRLLDVIAEAITAQPQELRHVEVFNAAGCRHEKDIRRYVPGLRHPLHTPFLGIWSDGVWMSSEQGHEARDHVTQLFGARSADIVEYVQDWLKAQAAGRKV